MRDRIYNVLRLWGSRADAAAAVGVDIGIICDEEKRDPVFAAGLRAAELDGKLLALATIRKAQTSDDLKLALDASKWIIERKYWKEFGKRKPDEITPDRLVAIIVQLTDRLRAALPKKYQIKIDAVVSDVVSALQVTGR